MGVTLYIEYGLAAGDTEVIAFAEGVPLERWILFRHTVQQVIKFVDTLTRVEPIDRVVIDKIGLGLALFEACKAWPDRSFAVEAVGLPTAVKEPA